jgi:hypothetical protein
MKVGSGSGKKNVSPCASGSAKLFTILLIFASKSAGKEHLRGKKVC